MRSRQTDRYARRSKARWSPDETVQLLAYLDFFVEDLRQYQRFSEGDVLQRLRDALTKQRSQSEISNKLRNLWGRNRAESSQKRFEELFRVGSGCLTRLDEKTRRQVQSELNLIRDREISLLVATPRQLRSSSRNIESRSTPLTSIHRERFEPGTPTKRGPSRQPQVPLRQRSESIKPCGDEVWANAGWRERAWRMVQLIFDPNQKDAAQDTSTPRKWETRSTSTPTLQCPRKRISTPLSDDAEVPDNHSESTPDTLDPGSPSSSQGMLDRLFYTDIPSDAPMYEYEHPVAAQTFLETPVFRGWSHETLRDLFNDNRYLREKWMTSEREKKQLEQQAQSMSSALMTKRTMSDLIINQGHRIANLRSQVESQDFLKNFFELGKMSHDTQNLGKIQKNIDLLKGRLRSLFMSKEFDSPPKDPLGEMPESLQKLMQDLSEKTTMPQQHDSMLHSLKNVPAWMTIQSLVGAAVRQWVFYTELRCLAILSTPLLEKYRSLLGSVCSEAALQNLDFAAHQLVMDAEDFRETFLDRTAEKLARRMLNALDPFLHDRLSNRGESQIESKLKAVFRHALLIKICAILGKDVLFEVVWPARESRFESDGMEAVPTEGDRRSLDVSRLRSSRIVLPLIPGLRKYKHKKNFVDYFGFGMGDQEDLGQSTVVSDAVVAVEWPPE